MSVYFRQHVLIEGQLIQNGSVVNDALVVFWLAHYVMVQHVIHVLTFEAEITLLRLSGGISILIYPGLSGSCTFGARTEITRQTLAQHVGFAIHYHFLNQLIILFDNCPIDIGRRKHNHVLDFLIKLFDGAITLVVDKKNKGSLMPNPGIFEVGLNPFIIMNVSDGKTLSGR